MTWLKCDDMEGTHPKIVALDAETFRLYHRSRLYAAHYLSEGRIPRSVVESLTTLRNEALGGAIHALLTPPPPYEHGLWEPDGENYRIHDFLEYNPTREQVLARQNRERKKKARRQAAGAARVEQSSNGRFVSRGKPPGEAPGGSPPLPVPVPVPVPGGVESSSLHGEVAIAEGRKEHDLPLPPPPPDALQATTGPVRDRKPAARVARPTPKSHAAAPPVPAAVVASNGTGGHLSPESGVDPAALQAAAAHGLAIRRAIATWTACFEKEHGTRPFITKGKDPAILARLIRAKGADEVCRLIKGYFETGTAWAREQQAWTIPAFASQYNKLLALDAEGSL